MSAQMKQLATAKPKMHSSQIVGEIADLSDKRYRRDTLARVREDS